MTTRKALVSGSRAASHSFGAGKPVRSTINRSDRRKTRTDLKTAIQIYKMGGDAEQLAA